MRSASAGSSQPLTRNLAKAKLALFFTAFLPQFLGDVTGNPTLPLLLLGIVRQSLGLIVDLVVGWTAGTMRHRVLGRPAVRRALDRLCAGVYAALAVLLSVDVARETMFSPAKR